MDAFNKNFVEILSELIRVPAPPGREEMIAEVIRGKITAFGMDCETDASGNVLVRLEGADKTKPKTILAAHMDEVAMVVTAIEESGNLRVAPSGGLHPCKLGECQVVIMTDNDKTVSGLFSMGSAHAKAAGNGVWAPDWHGVRIITGLSPQELKAAGVRPGSSAVPVKEGRGPYVFGRKSSPLISAWSFDDRAGVAILLLLLKTFKERGFRPSSPLIIAFTVHEEGGCYGARAMAMREKPEIFIAVDGCAITDQAVLKLDGRPGIWSKDAVCNYDQRLIRELLESAREADTELQPVVYEKSFSDASAICQAGAAARVAVLGHVCQNSHGFELARLSVFENVMRTILNYTEKHC